MRTKIMTLLAAALGLGFAQAASAADMPVKAAPAPIAPAVYNWSGIYGGVNIGWGGQSSTWTYTNPVPATPPTSSAHDVTRDDGIFGGHIGVQYQWRQLVLGVEAALSTPMSGDYGVSGTQCVSTAGSICQVQLGTLLTVGGRAGWAWDRWLAFVSGGWAQLNVNSRELTAPPTVFDFTGVKQDGFYIGGGVEYAVTNNIIAGIEYQHVDVGSAYHASSADGFGPSPPGVNGRNISATEDIVRARVSLKFGVPGILGSN
ncbi:MAG TPA: outer membrane beta-barrel protein [Pseudolabrys sp.]|nr:outer membrane beta-barrel protein [Pseudolabrys sp.]